jgi:hypothetical protein
LGKLAVSNELVGLLLNLKDQLRDTKWATGQVKTIGHHIERLQELDRQMAFLNPAKEEIASNIDLAALTEELKKKIIQAKDMIMVFQIRLKGGQELIKNKLKTAVKGRGIKGYKSVTLRS